MLSITDDGGCFPFSNDIYSLYKTHTSTFQIYYLKMDRLEFLGSPVETLGSPAAENVVIFLHGSGDTGRGIKVQMLRILIILMWILNSKYADPVLSLLCKYQCCGSETIYSGSGSSFEFSEIRIRIQAKVPDPCRSGSGSNLY